MKLDRVTFTGADDSVNPEDLVAISMEYPIVEWGILFSPRHQGQYRYPSPYWLKRFFDVMRDHPDIRLSAHLCGGFVRDLVLNCRFSWAKQHTALIFQRVQLNFHGEYHRMHDDFPNTIHHMPNTQFILQCDRVNDKTAEALAIGGIAVPLFDTSGGAGIVPERWPQAWTGVYCGYAGGLGPETIAHELPAIAAAVSAARAEQPFWIDMERRVRSADDSRFDLEKVRAVLQNVARIMETV